MSSQLQEDGSFINSIVGEGTSFRGDLELNGLLRIDGDFSGTIRTGGKVLVGVNGRAECTISAGTVVIGGVVKGNVYAEERVLVLSTGMMIGNISTPRLIAEEGVVLHGACMIRREGVEQPVENKAEEKHEAAATGENEPVAVESRDGAEQLESDSAEAEVYTAASESEIGTWNG